MTDGPPRVNLADVYRDSRVRLTELVSEIAEPAAVPVAACPGWSVHDVVSHLVGVIEDVTAGRLTGPPTDDQTAEQVGRRAGRPTGQVLEEWRRLAPALEELLAEVPVWPAALDALSHEHDVRAAVGRSGARDAPGVIAGAHRLIKALDPPAPMVVHLDGRTIRIGEDGRTGEAGGRITDGALELDTTAFEAFRFRLGRRSRRQLAAMRWTGDPDPVLDHLTIFGPSPADIEE